MAWNSQLEAYWESVLVDVLASTLEAKRYSEGE